MIAELSRWLLDRLEFAFLVPTAAALLCILLFHFRMLRIDLRLALWIFPAVCLLVGCMVAFSVSAMPLIDVLLITPRSVLLTGMATRFVYKRATAPGYAVPSPWMAA